MTDGKTLEARKVYGGRVVNLTVQTVRLPTGATVELEIVAHPGAAAAVALDGDGDVLLVRQYRHATGGWLLEVPAGKLDGGEDPEDCASREVEEEVGQRPGRLTPLGWIWTTPGFTDEKIWLYLATELIPSRQSLQADEALSVEKVPFAQAVAMAIDGTIVDAKSVCALLRAGAFLDHA